MFNTNRSTTATTSSLPSLPTTSSTSPSPITPPASPISPTSPVETLAAKLSRKPFVRSPSPRDGAPQSPSRPPINRSPQQTSAAPPLIGRVPGPAAIRSPRPHLQSIGRGCGRPPPQPRGDNDDEIFMVGKVLSARPPNPNSSKGFFRSIWKLTGKGEMKFPAPPWKTILASSVSKFREVAAASHCSRVRAAILGWCPKFITGFTLLGPSSTMGFTLLGPGKHSRSMNLPEIEYPVLATTPTDKGSAASA